MRTKLTLTNEATARPFEMSRSLLDLDRGIFSACAEISELKSFSTK